MTVNNKSKIDHTWFVIPLHSYRDDFPLLEPYYPIAFTATVIDRIDIEIYTGEMP